jgi:hypothetical protein
MKSVLKLIAVSLLALSTAQAVPVLQLDSPQGTWESSTETTVSTTDLFDIWALGKNPSGTYYLTAVVTPKTPIGDASFGSFKIGDSIYSVANGNLLHGAPPNPVGTHDNLFPSYYAQIAFSFGATTVASYNVQTGESAKGVLSQQIFSIDMSGLADGFGLHFDLFSLSGGSIDKFAPFSHDAEGRRTNVPDAGASAALLAIGIAGLALFGRVRKA